MRIEQVGFTRFKSLYDAVCTFDDVTVVTGPNGAGKSNLVHALTFIADTYSFGLEHAVGRAGGFDNLVHRRARRAKGPVAVSVQAWLDEAEVTGRPGEGSFGYWHRFELAAREGGGLADYYVVSDVIEIFSPDDPHVVYFSLTREDGRTRAAFPAQRGKHERDVASAVRPAMEPFDRGDLAELLTAAPLPATGLFLEGPVIGAVLTAVRKHLSRIHVLQLSPSAARAPGIPTPNAALGRHGDNLPAAADHLSRSDPPAWAQAQVAMRSIMPGLRSIQLEYTTERRLALVFDEAGVGRGWNADEVSDGTIQALALFLALYDRRNALLVVEEPENAVHPWVLRQFVDLCREAQGRQILLTTHSPVLLGYVAPTTIRLVSMAQGRSTVTPLLESAEELRPLLESGELEMFDLYDSGALLASVPHGLSADADLEAAADDDG